MATPFRLIVILAALPLAGLSFSYDVAIENATASDLEVTIRQYHSSGFDGNRDPELLDSNLEYEETDVIKAKDTATITFSDSGGGFWVTWSARQSSSSGVVCAGEVDFTKGHSPYLVKLTPEVCPVSASPKGP